MWFQPEGDAIASYFRGVYQVHSVRICGSWRYLGVTSSYG